MKRLAIKKYTVPVIALMMGGGWIFYPGKTGTRQGALTPVTTKAITCNMPVKARPPEIKNKRAVSTLRH